jgi:lipopolysaccharide biosynthesis glycosyltransferase
MYSVCFSANNAYIKHFATACASLLCNSKEPCHIFLLTDDLDGPNENKVRKMICELSSSSVFTPVRVEASMFSHLPQKFAYLNVQTYFRLKIAELLPESVSSLLYLDSDLVVVDSVSELFSEEAQEPLMAVEDMSVSNHDLEKRNLKCYFNAGVLYLPLGIWREQRFGDNLIRHVAPIMDYADQEILNNFFAEKWHALPKRFNVFSCSLGYVSFNKPKPCIIHFIGSFKPWEFWVPGSWHYWKYRFKTPYKPTFSEIAGTILPGIRLMAFKIKESLKNA